MPVPAQSPRNKCNDNSQHGLLILEDARQAMAEDRRFWLEAEEVLTKADLISASLRALEKALAKKGLAIVRRGSSPDDHCAY